MIHENNLVIGYGFLIRRDDREHVEELREWFTQVVREYPLTNKDLEFVTFYNEGAPESTISHELETSWLY